VRYYCWKVEGSCRPIDSVSLGGNSSRACCPLQLSLAAVMGVVRCSWWCSCNMALQAHQLLVCQCLSGGQVHGLSAWVVCAWVVQPVALPLSSADFVMTSNVLWDRC
jgi:hypothetical protein